MKPALSQVSITCDRTSYSCELEFKLKPFFGGSSNEIYGKVKLGSETVAHITGHWDGQIFWTDKTTGVSGVKEYCKNE